MGLKLYNTIAMANILFSAASSSIYQSIDSIEFSLRLQWELRLGSVLHQSVSSQLDQLDHPPIPPARCSSIVGFRRQSCEMPVYKSIFSLNWCLQIISHNHHHRHLYYICISRPPVPPPPSPHLQKNKSICCSDC